VATRGADNTYNNFKLLQSIRGQIPRTISNSNYLSLVDVVEGWILMWQWETVQYCNDLQMSSSIDDGTGGFLGSKDKNAKTLAVTF
jgi:hypothetical protein